MKHQLTLSAVALLAAFLAVPSVSASDLHPRGVDPSEILDPDIGLGGGGNGNGGSCEPVGLAGTPPWPVINEDCLPGANPEPSPSGGD